MYNKFINILNKDAIVYKELECVDFGNFKIYNVIEMEGVYVEFHESGIAIWSKSGDVLSVIQASTVYEMFYRLGKAIFEIHMFKR